MKKAIIIILAITFILSWQQPQKERYYGFQVPARLATQTMLLLQGETNQVSAADERETKQDLLFTGQCCKCQF